MVFAEVHDFDLRELFRGFFDEVAEDRFFVISDHANFLNVRYLCYGGETVPDDGMASDFEKRL